MKMRSVLWNAASEHRRDMSPKLGQANTHHGCGPDWQHAPVSSINGGGTLRRSRRLGGSTGMLKDIATAGLRDKISSWVFP